MDTNDNKDGYRKGFEENDEEFINDRAKKNRPDEASAKFSSLLNQFGDFMEEQSEKFQSGELGEKLEAMKNKAEKQAEEFWKTAKNAGRKFGDQVDDSIDKIKGKRDQTQYQNGGGI